MIGQSLGSYTIQRELGRGGMGAVYVGHHALLGRPAAVKVLLPEYSRNQEIVQRFFNEARAATAIRHPGIVEVYDFGFATDGAAYIVMELCDGESLAARLRSRRTLPPATALGFARQIAGALAAAHKVGIVHRDLKPDNVFLVPDAEVAGGERLKLLDFGIAKLGEGAGGGQAMARTSTGALMGTPYYMSPEQCRGAGHVDARSDLYSLGCILFEMVCGRVPFEGEGVGDIIGAHLHVAPPSPRAFAPGLPPDAERLILGLLVKKPDERIPTADAVVAEIRRLLPALGGETSGGYAVVAPPGSAPMLASASPPTPMMAAAVFTPPPAAAPMTATIPTMPGAPPSQAPITTLGASAAQLAPARRPRKAPWIAGGVLVCAGAVAAIVIASGGSSNKQADDARAIAGSAQTTAIAVDAASVAVAAPLDAIVAPPDAALVRPAADGLDGGAAVDHEQVSVETTVQACKGFRDAGDWTNLAVCATELRKLDPANPDGQALGTLAEREIRNKLALADLHDLIEKKDFGGAKEICDKRDDQSADKDKVIALCDRAKRDFIDQMSARARALASQHKCKDVAKLGQQAARVWPEAKDAVDAVSCTQPVASAAAGDGSGTAAAAPRAGCADTAQLIDDARSAAKTEQWGKAMYLCERAMLCDKGNSDAVVVCALAACNLKNTVKAKAYIGRLSASRQAMARQTCLRNGIDPGGGS